MKNSWSLLRCYTSTVIKRHAQKSDRNTTLLPRSELVSSSKQQKHDKWQDNVVPVPNCSKCKDELDQFCTKQTSDIGWARSTIWLTDPHWGGLEATLGHVSWTSQSTSPEDFSNQLRLTLVYFTYLDDGDGIGIPVCGRSSRDLGTSCRFAEVVQKKIIPTEISIPKKSPPPSTKKMS